ncbi:MAG: DUF5134 domain-containing protein [Propionicimonas sp.]|uniref:DUF5134 domain-containing protein n=1 Tax=Propionicimonas sp. TaxID=1955623 RepID=UPI003D146A64
MFSFTDTPWKFVGLLVLFAWCTVWCAYELTRPQDVRQRISNALHLVMALVMLLMVAGPTWQVLTAFAPTPVLVGLFALSTAWFAWLAFDVFTSVDRRGGWHFTGHAAMFAAMTWHLAAMASMSAGMSAGMGASDGGMGGMDMGHGSGGAAAPMDMEAWMAAASGPGGVLWVFALVGLPLMAYLLWASVVAVRDLARPRAAVNDACACGTGCTCGPDCACSASHAALEQPERELVLAGAPTPVRAAAPVVMAHSCHEERPAGSVKYRLAAASDLAMNAGMFWMSTGLLVPVLPFLAALAF